MRLKSVEIFHLGDEVRGLRSGDNWRGRITDINARGSPKSERRYEFTIQGKGWEITAFLGDFEHSSLLDQMAREAARPGAG